LDSLGIEAKGVLFNSHRSQLKEFIEKVAASGFEADDVAQLKKAAQDALSDHARAEVYVEQMGKQEKFVRVSSIRAIRATRPERFRDSRMPFPKEPGRARQGTETQDQRQANARRA
jgi:hypothetical protein